jgi:hypothetical protein
VGGKGREIYFVVRECGAVAEGGMEYLQIDLLTLNNEIMDQYWLRMTRRSAASC